MAILLSHAEPTTEPDPVVGSRLASTEFLLRLGGTWGRTEQSGRHPYRTFEWHRGVTMAGTPLWMLVLGWQEFDDTVAIEGQPDPPWKFTIEVWDNDVSVPDHDITGKQVMEQLQTRDFDLVAHVVQTFLDHTDDENVGS